MSAATQPQGPDDTMPTVVGVRVLSAHAGFITGGTALVEVEGVGARLLLNGTDVTSDLTAGRGLVSGFADGENVLRAEAGGGQAVVTVCSRPVEGPLFSGPHLHPWLVTTQDTGLGAPVDEHGNAPSRIDHHYMSVRTGTFEAYDPQDPPDPDEVAATTTDDGVTVPYVVQRELGSANRGLFELAVLCDPARPWSPAAPQDGWNHKLWIYSYGGWNQHWSQSSFELPPIPPGAKGPLADPSRPAPRQTVLNDMGLRRGFMVARTTQMQSRTNSDTVRAAESLVMLKEHVVKNYGTIRYTFGSGASGGSIMQQMIANQYPGIFQGIIPMSSIHSSWYLPSVINECRLLARYFTETSPELWSEDSERLAVDGHRSEEVRAFFNEVFGAPLTAGNDPRTGTGLPPEQTYRADDNPSGARGTLQDYQVNYLGRRPPAVWTAAERAAGRGFAHYPWDNTGVQYGLAALLDRRISVEQFVDLNAKVGGVDLDGALVAERTDADPEGIARLHRCGLVNDYAHMDTVAILDLRNPEHEDPIRTHTQFHTWVTRAGLLAAHGHADNHVAWIVPGFSTGSVPTEAAFLAMDRWLAAVEDDTGPRTPAEKVAANKPDDLTDGIRTLEGDQRGDLAAYRRTYPSYGDARLVAACGDLRAYRVAKPQLRPLRRDDYPGVVFTDDQWRRLETAFPQGVADWAAPGVAATPSVPWLSYQDGPGGQPLLP